MDPPEYMFVPRWRAIRIDSLFLLTYMNLVLMLCVSPVGLKVTGSTVEVAVSGPISGAINELD